MGTLAEAVKHGAFQPKPNGRWTFDHTYVRTPPSPMSPVSRMQTVFADTHVEVGIHIEQRIDRGDHVASAGHAQPGHNATQSLLKIYLYLITACWC